MITRTGFWSLAFSALFVATGLHAQQRFDALDTNRDSHLDVDEMTTWWEDERVFDRWDLDADSTLDRDEVDRGIMTVWDLDGDGIVQEYEWDRGVDRLYGDHRNPREFAEWDLNADAELDMDEVAHGLQRTGWHEDWSMYTNPRMDYDEFSGKYYTLWDLDDDGLVDTVEYDTGLDYWIF